MNSPVSSGRIDELPRIVDQLRRAFEGDASSNAAWINSIDTLKKRHSDLCSAISAMPEQRLLATVPGKDYDFYHMLHGAVQHALYHAGQIVLLKKSSALAAQI